MHISSNKHFLVFCLLIYRLLIILQIAGLQTVHISKCNFSSIIIYVQSQIANSLCFTINKWSKNNQSNSINNRTFSTSPLYLHTHTNTHILYDNDNDNYFCSISFQKLIRKFYKFDNFDKIYSHCHSTPDGVHQVWRYHGRHF